MQRLTYADRLMMVAIVLWLIFFALLAAKAFGHEGPLLACSGYTQAVKTGEGILENGMFIEAYDVDGDGRVDVNTLSDIGAGHSPEAHNPYPVFYWIDTDKDGKVDEVYIDKFGEGQCSSIVFYADGSQTLDRKRTVEQ